MSSDNKLSFEWCVKIPSRNQTRESPVFLLRDNKCFFTFGLNDSLNLSFSRYYEINFEFKTKRKPLPYCIVQYQIGFKNEKALSLKKGKFEVAERNQVFFSSESILNSKIREWGQYIKLLFEFEETVEPLSKNTKETEDKSVQTSPYIDACVLLEGVSKDFSKLFLEGPDHDVEFACGGETVKAHKNILCCRSEVFASMLQADMLEGKTGEVKIEDMEVAVFRQFLKCLYSGDLPQLTVDVAMPFYEAADKYAVGALKKQCASFLEENLSPENACEILILSDRHSDPDFKKNVMEYLLVEKIPLMGDKWTDFCKENPALANEVLNLSFQRIHRK